MLLNAFEAEHKEHLVGIRGILAKAESGEPLTAADLDEAFRRAHSLKAAARVCDLNEVEKLGRALESLFARLREGAFCLNREVLDVVRLVLDSVEDGGVCLAEKQPVPQLRPALEAIERILEEEAKAPEAAAEATDLDAKLLAAFHVEHREHLEGIRSILTKVDGGTFTRDQLEEVFRRAHSLKGAARLAELRPIESLAHRLENLFSSLREGSLVLGHEAFRAIHLTLDSVEDCAACLAENRSLPEPGPSLEAIDQLLGTNPERGGVLAERPPPQTAAVPPAMETVR